MWSDRSEDRDNSRNMPPVDERLIDAVTLVSALVLADAMANQETLGEASTGLLPADASYFEVPLLDDHTLRSRQSGVGALDWGFCAFLCLATCRFLFIFVQLFG